MVPGSYPVVPGHEVIGTIVAVGPHCKGRSVASAWAWAGTATVAATATLPGRRTKPVRQASAYHRRSPRRFADRVRAHWSWAIPVPAGLDPASAGPLLCGSGTVFLPFVINDTSSPPTGWVWSVLAGWAILAVKFARAWGCEVTAFTSSASKRDEALALGAHRTASSVDVKELKSLAGSLDFLLVTVGAALEWDALIGTLAPRAACTWWVW